MYLSRFSHDLVFPPQFFSFDEEEEECMGGGARFSGARRPATLFAGVLWKFVPARVGECEGTRVCAQWGR